MQTNEQTIKKATFIFSVVIFLCVSLLTTTSVSYAGTKKLSEKSKSRVLMLTDGGYIGTRTYLSGDLTYKDSSAKRTFTKEHYFMYATSINDPSLVKRIRVTMGVLKLHAGGKVYKCKRNGKDSYYADPKWIAHDSATSKTTAKGKLKGSSWAELTSAITGDGLINTKNDWTAKWKNIAK